MQIITSAGGKSLRGSVWCITSTRIGISAKLVPVFPVTPTGLSYEAGEKTVDPRSLTPGMMITNGEDL